MSTCVATGELQRGPFKAEREAGSCCETYVVSLKEDTWHVCGVWNVVISFKMVWVQ